MERLEDRRLAATLGIDLDLQPAAVGVGDTVSIGVLVEDQRPGGQTPAGVLAARIAVDWFGPDGAVQRHSVSFFRPPSDGPGWHRVGQVQQVVGQAGWHCARATLQGSLSFADAARLDAVLPAEACVLVERPEPAAACVPLAEPIVSPVTSAIDRGDVYGPLDPNAVDQALPALCDVGIVACRQ